MHPLRKGSGQAKQLTTQPVAAYRIRTVAKAAKIAIASKAFTVKGSSGAATVLKSAINKKLSTLHGIQIYQDGAGRPA